MKYNGVAPQRLLIVGGMLLLSIAFLQADTGNPVLQDALASATPQTQFPVGAPDAFDAVAAIVARAEEMPGAETPWMIPPATVVDDVRWLDNRLEIRLTVPAERSASWILTATEQESLSLAFGRPFADDPAFAGTHTLVRTGPDQPYDSLEQFLLHPVLETPAAEAAPSEIPLPLDAGEQTAPGAPSALRGPTANAARQPQGALSGVTVYVSAGHGWTAGDSAWYLQRPVLLEMAEDYGNIDQINYFVQYAFNAGATVVPLRPVGWQPIEIVLDNDDPGVTYAGAWSNGSSSKYYENGVTVSGIPYKWISATTTETATARYTPNITVTDFYPVYCFTVAGTNRTRQTYRVVHSGGASEITIDHRETGNGWIWLGTYFLVAGEDNYVEITNASDTAGAVVADAIRWGGGVGDISRPGPGRVSGYSRDEECQRYWAHSELGNHAVGFDSDIWDGGGSADGDDNVRTGGKWAREMNQVPAGGIFTDRWKRIHLEFHTNASGGTSRGQICLITDLGETTYQREYATTLSNEVDADLSLIDGEFEHEWVDRSSATYTSSYGAICTGANSDEFDATIVELAFHDNELDTQLLRDDRVRAAMGRACTQGIIRFLHGLSGSQVPLAFAPDTPRNVSAIDLGDGSVRLSWIAPLADGARGDPATGYVIYDSSNGYGFGNPTILGNVLTVDINGLAEGELRYFRVAATNAGGESMPSEVLAVRRPAPGDHAEKVLIVNGFDRLRRQINPTQTFTQPAAYAGDVIERQIWRRSNAYDYVIEHGEALAAAGYGFDSASNEAASATSTFLDPYDVLVWILGTESTEDATFSTSEQNVVTNFLLDGKALFVSGADLGLDLIGQTHGVNFMRNTLRADYAADDANTYNATGIAGSCLDGLGSINFNPASGAAYDVRSPDRLAAGVDAAACLQYVGGTGGVAGVQYGNGLYNVVVFGFPFETISVATARNTAMTLVMDFLTSNHEPLAFNYDRDFDVDWTDFEYFQWCFQGPDYTYPTGSICVDVYGEEDLDIDLEDFSMMQKSFTGPR